jgi:hypothetical protein
MSSFSLEFNLRKICSKLNSSLTRDLDLDRGCCSCCGTSSTTSNETFFLLASIFRFYSENSLDPQTCDRMSLLIYLVTGMWI